jgi:biopolymer transport protein TolQ
MGHFIVGAVLGGRLASLDPFALVWQASWVVQLVLAVLVLFSVVSWAAILFKWRELRGAQSDSEAFLDVYHEGSRDAAYEAARELDRGPLPAIYLAAYTERNRMARYGGGAAHEALDDDGAHRLGRQVAWVAAQETHRLERRLPFLATTASTTPFIGLFGTVIGIINAFTGIGQAGSASLAVVAPGIAEALIATALGLFAAIPASVFYNVFVGRLRELHGIIDVFRDELTGDFRRAPPRSAPARAAGR